ncbi:MAG TPA: two-component regulator propeller domain-containing protein [Verrucomicrobiaceae bacterium]
MLAETEGPKNASSAPGNWVGRSWRVEDGLPQNTVNAVLQTRDGYLWVGTNAGLARFDGQRFRKFGLQNGLRSVLVLSLAEDIHDSLWIGTSGGGLSRWHNGTLASFGAAEGFSSSDDVIALAADRDGSLWIGTDKGLVHWQNGSFESMGEAEGLPRTQIRALAQDSRGVLWVSALLDGLYRGSNGKFAKLAEGPAAGNVYTLMEDHDGAMWAGTDDGHLWRWREDQWKLFDSASGLPRSNIDHLVQGPDGSIWAGARNTGLFRLGGDQFLPVVGRGEMPGRDEGGMAVDREGSIWVGTRSGGLSRLSPRVLDYWGALEGLPETSVTSVTQDSSGALWIGTGNKGLFRMDDDRIRKIEDPLVSGNELYLYCTASTSDGSVWIAGEQCLYRLRGDRPIQAFLEKPVRGEAIRALCADGETLWAGTYYATLLKCDATGVHVVAPAGTFPGGITSIVVDHENENSLWISTSGGLHHWDHGKIQSWTTRDGLLTTNIRALHRDSDGTLWLGTLGGGLSRMKDGRFTNFTTRQGLIDDVISQIIPDDFDCLWLGSNRGLMRLTRRELDAVADGKSPDLRPMVFGRNEGMLKEQCVGGHSPTAIKTRDGRLCFPTADGMASIDPRRVQSLSESAPRAGIEEFLVDNQARDARASHLVFSPGNHRLAFNFSAPLMRGGDWIQFRHRLEGLDTEWVNSGTNRFASYEGLFPGAYVFRVAADDGHGHWSDPGDSIAFTIQPSFWQTIWFRAGGALLLVGVSGTVAWRHTHQRHRRHIAELERTRQQQAELARFGRISTMGQLTAALAHELNQPLAAILSNAQAARRFLAGGVMDVAELHAILEDIIRDDKRASGVIHNLRAMLGKAPVLREECLLNDLVREAAHFVKGEAAEHEIEFRLSLTPSEPRVNAARIEIQQVLVNLFLNAIQAMQDTPPQHRVIDCTTLDGGGVAIVTVRDRGHGIPPERLGSVFEPFFTTKPSGLGMGLAICRRLIESHGGRIEARHGAGMGAEFSFTLPTVSKNSLQP